MQPQKYSVILKKNSIGTRYFFTYGIVLQVYLTNFDIKLKISKNNFLILSLVKSGDLKLFLYQY